MVQMLPYETFSNNVSLTLNKRYGVLCGRLSTLKGLNIELNIERFSKWSVSVLENATNNYPNYNVHYTTVSSVHGFDWPSGDPRVPILFPGTSLGCLHHSTRLCPGCKIPFPSWKQLLQLC